VEEPAATVGVLALQGDVLEHEAAFAEVGVATRRVRRPSDLDGIDGLVLPGGESTTLSMLLVSSGLFEPIAQGIAGGLPTFGTCAGLILLAGRVEDGRGDQRTFSALHCAVRRNGYGPQRFSFEGVAEPVGDALDAGEGPLPAVFIRAPLVTEVWGDAQVLATESSTGSSHGPAPVVLRQGHVLAATFHPELTADRRLQRLFAEMARSAKRAPAASAAYPAPRPIERRPSGEPVAARR
jgi:5'-phosphate synthase pdxT subunit